MDSEPQEPWEAVRFDPSQTSVLYCIVSAKLNPANSFMVCSDDRGSLWWFHVCAEAWLGIIWRAPYQAAAIPQTCKQIILFSSNGAQILLHGEKEVTLFTGCVQSRSKESSITIDRFGFDRDFELLKLNWRRFFKSFNSIRRVYFALWLITWSVNCLGWLWSNCILGWAFKNM